MMRQILILSMVLTLGWTSVGCGPVLNDSASSRDQIEQSNRGTERPVAAQTQTRLADGQYPVQQVTYDDAVGEYTVMLLNTGPGQPSTFRSQNLPMARLTDQEIAAGQKSVLKVEQGQPSLYLTEDFRIEYVHNVTQTQTDPQTGRQETVVVRQESNFWAPFAGALAGQAIGSLLFRPQYYMPPVYQPGLPLRGFGGYGSTYGQAVQSYQSRYNQPPAAVRNRQTFRTTGQLRSPTYGQPGYRSPRSSSSDRSTGSGYGTSTLRRSNRPSSSTYRRSPSSGFGSGRSSTRSFGSRRR